MRIPLKKAIAEALPVEMAQRVDPKIGFDPEPDVIVLAASSDWVLARNLRSGLEPDGYFAVLRRQISSLQTSKYQLFRKQILIAEKSWNTAVRLPTVDLTNTASILRSLQKLGKFAIVLCETFEEWDAIHCRIEQVADDHALLRGFDGVGKWDVHPVRVQLSDITKIRFGSRYLKLYQKRIA